MASAAAVKKPAAATLHLVRRTTYGLTPALVAEAKTLTAAQWVARQLAWQKLDDAPVTRLLTRMAPLGDPPLKVLADAKAANRFGNWDQMQALGFAAVARAVWSRRQLLERMVDVWANHLNVANPSDSVWATRADYDATVIRPNALGTFRALLRAAIQHPAMLSYLNNDSSAKDNPNENLGRELLELHTVGIGARYSEADVKTCARILTGLSVDWDTGAFVYRPSWHWTGPVSVLGFSAANASADGGRQVALDLLDHLARHPATARRIATLLATQFVSDTPPAALVTRLAAAYTRADTAIAPVLTQLLLSPEFVAAAEGKVRRPAEQLYAAARALGVGPDATGIAGIQWLYWETGNMGDAPAAWATPDGYPLVADEWRSSAAVLNRINTVTALAEGWQTSLTNPAATSLLPRTRPSTHGALVAALYARLHYRAVPTADLKAVCSWLGVTAATPVTGTSAAVTWQLSSLVGVLLNAPALAVY